MPDPREWISRIKEVEPPDLWEEAAARAGSVSESDRAAFPDGHPSSRQTNPRRAALATGVAAGILALAIVALAIRTGPTEKGEKRATPTPEVSSLSEAHELLERLLSDLWTAEARLAELQGALEAAHDELIVLQDELGPDPTEEQLREIDTYQERIQAWTQSVRESQALVTQMRARVAEVRAVRAELVPPPDVEVYPDVATVTCDGERTGGTHLSTPVVRSLPDGVHVRVVNQIPNERVHLIVQPDGGWAIPPGETRVIVMPPRPSHEVELMCTFANLRNGFDRPTHPLWIAGSVACPAPPFTVSQLPWLPEGAAVPAAEPIDQRPDSGFVWFEVPEERFAGMYVALTRSPWSPFDHDLSEFPTAKLRGTTGHLVWVGDPGVGELALVWREAGSSCEWYTLSISSAGLSEVHAEQTIQTLAASLS